MRVCISCVCVCVCVGMFMCLRVRVRVSLECVRACVCVCVRGVHLCCARTQPCLNLKKYNVPSVASGMPLRRLSTRTSAQVSHANIKVIQISVFSLCLYQLTLTSCRVCAFFLFLTPTPESYETERGLTVPWLFACLCTYAILCVCVCVCVCVCMWVCLPVRVCIS